MKIALIVLITGVILMLVAPFIFTQHGWISFATTGQIGDTIGGITAPISNLVGAILLFLALKSQVAANMIAQEQINGQQLLDRRKKEIIYIADLYKFLSQNIRSFEIKYFKGYKAIRKIMNMLADKERSQAHDEHHLYYGTVAELYSILQLGKLFLEQVKNSSIESHDKQFFIALVKHHYESFILPYLGKTNEDPACPICGEEHNGIPLKIAAVIHETVQMFTTIKT